MRNKENTESSLCKRTSENRWSLPIKVCEGNYSTVFIEIFYQVFFFVCLFFCLTPLWAGYSNPLPQHPRFKPYHTAFQLFIELSSPLQCKHLEAVTPKYCLFVRTM